MACESASQAIPVFILYQIIIPLVVVNHKEKLRNMNNNRTVVILAVLLLLSLIGLGWFWTKSSRLQGENTGFETQVDSLSTLKYDLLDNIDSLQTAYQLIIAKNDSLGVSLEDALQTVAGQNEQLKSLKRQNSNDKKGLLQQINQLRALKSELEGNIGQLIEENESLRQENSELTEQVETATKRNQELADKSSKLESANLALQSDLSQLRAKSVRASGFLVDLQTRSSKTTSKSGRVRNLSIAFDVVDVPQEHQGTHTLYLVITDANGNPIASDNPVRKRIEANGMVAEIIAQQAKEVTLEESQRLNFNYPISEKLKRGTYQVSIYSDLGLLGSSNVKVT